MPDLAIAVRDNTRRGVASAVRNLTTLKDKAQAASRSMGGLGDRTQKTGVQFAQSAMKMAGFSMALGSVGLAMRSVIKSGTDFEFTMARVGAVTGATGKSFDALNKQAKDLGASTVFSASEAADAMQFLGMAGMKTNQIMSAMPTTLQLAAAGAMELGQTADIVTNILSGMRLEVSDLESVANGLAVAATSSNTSISLLGESFSYASGISASVGLQFADVAAALGKLGDAGLKGSRAGMNLSMAMAKVLDPSKEAAEVMDRLSLSFMNADGTMVDLVDMVQQLEKAQISAQDQFKLFGVQGGRAIAALTAAGAPALEKLRTSIESNSTALDEMSDKMGATTQNKMKALTSAVEGLQLEMFDKLAPALTDVVEQLTLVARSDDAVQVMRDLGTATGDLAKSLIEIGKFVREYGDELMLLATLLGAGKAGSLLGKGAAMVGAGGAAAALPAATLAAGAGVGVSAYARSKIDPMVAEEGGGNLFDTIGNAMRDGWKGFWFDAPEGAFGTGGSSANQPVRYGLDFNEEVKRYGAMTNQGAAAMYGSPQGFGAAGLVLPDVAKLGGRPTLGKMGGFGGDLDATGDGSLLSLLPKAAVQAIRDYNTEIDLQIEMLTASGEMARLVAQQELELHAARVANDPQPHVDGLKRLHTAQKQDLKDKIELRTAEEKAAKATQDLEEHTEQLAEEQKKLMSGVSDFVDVIGTGMPKVAAAKDAFDNIMAGFSSGGPLGAAVAGFTSFVNIMEKGQMSAEELGRAINDMLNEGARGAKDAMELLYGDGTTTAAQERMFAPLLEFYNTLDAGSGPERVKNFFAALSSFDFNDRDVYDISKDNPFTKIIDEAFGDGTMGTASIRTARRTFENLMREAFGGEMSFVDMGLEMVETGDAFEGLRESAEAAKEAVNGLSDAEDRHTRLVYDQQEIAARAGLSRGIQQAGADVFEQRRAYQQFQDVIASIKRSETLARSRGGAGTPVGAGTTPTTGTGTVGISTPAGNALTISPIAPTNWNSIIDEDTLRAATPIPVVWSEILALLDRSHTRIGNARGDDLGSWELVVDTGKLRGMQKINVRWTEVTDLMSNPSAKIGGGMYELHSWNQIVNAPTLDRMSKIRVKWSDALELLDKGHTRIGKADGDTLDKWNLVVDSDNLKSMEQIKVKWSDILELLDKSHTRIGKADDETALDHWNLVVDSDNLKSMNKIDVNWSDIINPTKSNISLNTIVGFTPFDFGRSMNWQTVVLPQLKDGIKESVENISVPINLANLIHFDTADLSDAISRKVQEAIDDRQIETTTDDFVALGYAGGRA